MQRFITTMSTIALITGLKATEKPNIIVIMADDLGYNDLGFQGSKTVKTPNLDQLAQTGVIFTDAHTTASVCSPSRAGFMTGRYQQRFGHEGNCPRGEKGMDTSEYTMGQAFKDLDYNTYLLGKWHLGATEQQYPTARGFDEFWGLREGSRNYFYGGKQEKLGNPQAIEHNGKHIKFEGHLTDRITDEAIRMIAENKIDKPFFMFLSYTAPHGPLQPTPEDLARANGNKYHALVQNMDDNIGRLVEFIDAKRIRKNTVIWFLSDNGGTAAAASNMPLNGQKGIKFEGGQRVPFIFNWQGKIEGGKTFDKLTSALDIFATSHKIAGGTSTPKPLDGVDLLPYLNGKRKSNPHKTLYWRKLEGAAVRSGKWKLIKTEGLPPMIYNLGKDLGELNNRAKANPEKLKELEEKLAEWEKGLIDPLWREGKGFIKIRQKKYIKYRDSERVRTILGEKL